MNDGMASTIIGEQPYYDSKFPPQDPMVSENEEEAYEEA